MKPFTAVAFVTIAALHLSWLLCANDAFGATQSSGLTSLRIADVTINVIAPEGFIETSANSPQLWQQAKSMTSGYSEVIAHFVTKKDFDAFVENKNPGFSEYFIVLTPKSAKNLTTTQQQFDTLRSDIAVMQSELKRNIEPRLTNELRKFNSSLSSQSGKPLAINIGQIVPVSVNINRTNFLSYSVLSQLSTSNESVVFSDTMVITTGICLLKDKVLMLNYYRVFKSPQDLEASRKSVEVWADSLLALNTR